MQKEVLLIMSNVVIPVIVGAVCAVVFAEVIGRLFVRKVLYLP